VRNRSRHDITLADYPAVARWHYAIVARPAAQREVEVLSENGARAQ